MAFVNADGKHISYECSGLIKELKQDIKECGGNKIVSVWCKEYEGVIIYTNYDFITDESPIQPEELRDGEFLREMSMNTLLDTLIKQNDIV